MQLIVRRFMELTEERATYSVITVVDPPVRILYSCQGMEATDAMLKQGRYTLCVETLAVGTSAAIRSHGTLDPSSASICVGIERLIRDGVPCMYGTGQEIEALRSALGTVTTVEMIVVDGHWPINPSLN